MKTSITISIPNDIKQKIDKLTRREQVTRSVIVCEALKEYFAKQEYHRLRNKLIPEAEKCSLFTDEDIFRIVS